MKYTKEATDKLIELYEKEVPTVDIAVELNVPERSVIAKLSSLGIYKKKPYLNKRGEIPVRKEELIQRIAASLKANIDTLESLEKVNKSVLQLLDAALSKSD